MHSLSHDSSFQPPWWRCSFLRIKARMTNSTRTTNSSSPVCDPVPFAMDERPDAPARSGFCPPDASRLVPSIPVFVVPPAMTYNPTR